MSYGESGSWMRGGAIAAFAVVALLSCILPSVSPNVQGAGDVIVAVIIKLDSDSAVADVENGLGTVLLSGTVSFNPTPACRGAAIIKARTDTGWPAFTSPSAMVGSEHPQKIIVTVTVPQGTHSNITGRLSVDGKYCIYPWTGHASANITAGPYHGVRCVLERPVQPAGPGMPPRFEVVVTNTGNAVDSFYCAVKEPRIASMHRWCYRGSSSFLMDMAPGESRTVTFNAELTNPNIHPAEGLWSDVFFVQSVNARAQNRTVGQDIRLTVHSRPGWWELVDVPMAAVIMWAAAICAMLASVVRTKKRQKSIRAPALREVGGDERQ